MDLISNVLFIVSNGLLIPVLLLLIFFLIKAVAMVITLLPEISRQRRERNAMCELLESESSSDDSDLVQKMLSIDDSLFKSTLSDIINHRHDPAYCERKIANYEIDVKAILAKSRQLIKFGPLLGLMGTLIPMGPALVGLASGDLATMAYNMQVAFATTVIGMVIAAIGVLTLQINQHYYAYTINDLDYFCEKIVKTDI